MTTINQNNIFYHIYPFGACAAPHFNDFQSAPQPRLRQIFGWLDHIQSLGLFTLGLDCFTELQKQFADICTIHVVILPPRT